MTATNAAPTEDTVSSLYSALRTMAAGFAFKPGERINESALSKKLGASRTPLREALNRLVAEGFITYRSGQGFFCRPLSPERVLHLYEARLAIECEAARRATERAMPEMLAGVSTYLEAKAVEYETTADANRMLEIDEGFHLHLCEAAGNPEFTLMLHRIYDKIRFVRLADLRRLRSTGAASTTDHRLILAAVEAGAPDAAAAAMRRHIEGRLPHATEAVRLAFADLYAPLESDA